VPAGSGSRSSGGGVRGFSNQSSKSATLRLSSGASTFDSRNTAGWTTWSGVGVGIGAGAGAS
jgi:hypothetical protein